MTKNRSKIWLSSPHMGGGELSFIHSAFNQNWIAPLGPNVEGFENDLEQYINTDLQIAALSSGTAAIHLALIMLGVEQGDVVICQSLTFSATANPIVYQGATPVFVDSEPSTWNICPNALEDAIKTYIKKGKKPKAIIGVHLYGMPFQVTEILSICRKYEIPLIEDSAEALGSLYKGQKCGQFGDFGILSFNGNKIITTSGGGALVCKEKSQKEKAVFLATQARDKAPHYQHSHIGYNYRMSNITAGIGRGQMQVLDSHVQKRRKNNDFYKEIFSHRDDLLVFNETTTDYKSNHWLSCILFTQKNTHFNPTILREHLATYNIESRPVWKPMHMQPIFNKAPYFGGKIAEEIFTNGLCLPSGSNLSIDDKDYIDKALSVIVT